MNDLSVLFRDIKKQSHKAFMKIHNECYIKNLIVVSEDGKLKAKHCRDHNVMFILSFEGIPNAQRT